jgi:DNA-binding Lrp family transcriptional regulator
MAVKSYCLITATAKESKNVLERLRASGIVQSAEAVTGPYDIIAIIGAEDMDALGQLITREIHSIEGVDRTLTCVVMSL